VLYPILSIDISKKKMINMTFRLNINVTANITNKYADEWLRWKSTLTFDDLKKIFFVKI
jgi:hypothetical protein